MTLERRLRRVEQTLLVGAAQFETQEELMQHWMICGTLQMTIILKATWMTLRWTHCSKIAARVIWSGKKSALP